VNRGLSLPRKGFLQHLVQDATLLFTLRLRLLSHSETGQFEFETFA
jgi:hypothetical protein